MLNILFIYSDSRIANVVDTLRGLTQVPICVASDFDSGLQDIFEKRPQQIFIQEEIGGVSCVALAVHIKQLLRDGAPRIVLLRDDPGRKLLVGRDNFDDTIDLCGLTDDLLAAVCLRLESVPGMLWRSEVPDRAVDPVFTDESAIDRMAADLLASVADAPLTQEIVLTPAEALEPETAVEEISLVEQFTPVAPLVVPVAPEPVAMVPAEPPQVTEAVKPVATAKPDASDRLFAENAPPETAAAVCAMPDPMLRPDPGEEFSGVSADEGFAPLESVFALRNQRQRRSRQYIAGGMGLLLLVIGGYFLLHSPAPRPVNPPPAPAPVATAVQPLPASVPAAPQAPAPAVGAELPSMLAAAAIDPTYGARRAGWERRTTADYEVLVYREGTVVRALQVIARGSAGLADQVIAAVFQFAGGTAVIWQKEEKRGDFLIEQGVLPNRYEVLRYTRPGGKVPAALVVAVP